MIYCFIHMNSQIRSLYITVSSELFLYNYYELILVPSYITSVRDNRTLPILCDCGKMERSLNADIGRKHLCQISLETVFLWWALARRSRMANGSARIIIHVRLWSKTKLLQILNKYLEKKPFKFHENPLSRSWVWIFKTTEYSLLININQSINNLNK